MPPRGSASGRTGTSTYDLLDGAPLAELAKPTKFPNLHLIPAKPDLAGATVELTQHSAGETYLRQALAAGTEEYSFVFLDCPPSFGPLTVNALAAADRVLIPVQAEYYALEGLSQLVHSINLVKARLNPKLAVGGVLLTMVDGRTRLSADVEAEVRKHFGELVFTQTVPRSVRLAEAPSHGLPAIAYDRRSRGCGRLLEGGDGACRARLNARASAEAWRFFSVGATATELARASRRCDSSEPSPAEAPLRLRSRCGPGGFGARTGRRAAGARAPARGRRL